MRPIAPDMHRIQPPMYGPRPASRGRARARDFSSAPGMLVCPRLSAPPRLPPAPPALLPEAAWYIASLTAHSSQSFSPLSRSQSCVRFLACFIPCTTLVRIPAVQSLLPLDPRTRCLCYRVISIPLAPSMVGCASRRITFFATCSATCAFTPRLHLRSRPNSSDAAFAQNISYKH